MATDGVAAPIAVRSRPAWIEGLVGQVLALLASLGIAVLAGSLLIASQPTRGLDVGAIEFVWRQILHQKEEGRGVLLISAELDEIYALADRIVTLYEGRITGEYAPDAEPEEIGVGMLGGRLEVAS